VPERIRFDDKAAGGERSIIDKQDHNANGDSRRQTEQAYSLSERLIDVHYGDRQKQQLCKNDDNDPLHGHNGSFAEQNPVPSCIECLLQRNQRVLLGDLLTCVLVQRIE
jgi:hypothetical protein